MKCSFLSQERAKLAVERRTGRVRIYHEPNCTCGGCRSAQRGASFNRFDICDAWYLLATRYHGGMHSQLYRVFGRLEKIGYRPADGLSVETLSENARVIYHRAVNEHALAGGTLRRFWA